MERLCLHHSLVCTVGYVVRYCLFLYLYRRLLCTVIACNVLLYITRLIFYLNGLLLLQVADFHSLCDCTHKRRGSLLSLTKSLRHDMSWKAHGGSKNGYHNANFHSPLTSSRWDRKKDITWSLIYVQYIVHLLPSFRIRLPGLVKFFSARSSLKITTSENFFDYF
jgi:hypothetical protein